MKTVFRRFQVPNFIVLPVLLLAFTVLGLSSAWGFESGKTYDKSNYQEIEKHLPQFLKAWMQQGKIIAKTGSLDFDFGDQDAAFDKKTAANKGKFDFDEDGQLIETATGEIALYVEGFPFPDIDPKDPKAGMKVMDNFQASREHQLIYNSAAEVEWIGDAFERSIKTGGAYMYYFNRLDGQIPNPNKFRKQDLTNVLEPFDLRGTVTMGWEYVDMRENTSFAYVPMLRRVRRTSAASRSDPFLGSDGCVDDAAGYGGKNGAMTWKLVGDMDTLVPLVSNKKHVIKRLSNGTFDKVMFKSTLGYEAPGWQGAAWAPAAATWVLRPCWVVECFPKDPYYNYGQQNFYVDKDGYIIYYKECYNRAGEYWKTVAIGYSYQTTDDDKWMCYSSEIYLQVDDKSNHATVPRIVEVPGRNKNYNAPLDVIGPHYFTVANLLQLSK